MDWRKPIDFRGEFTKRLWDRCIIEHYNYDMERCIEEIESKMKEEGIIMLDPKSPVKVWCLIKIENIGLIKIILAETNKTIKAITIACPVTNPECHRRYNEAIKNFKSNKK